MPELVQHQAVTGLMAAASKSELPTENTPEIAAVIGGVAAGVGILVVLTDAGIAFVNYCLTTDSDGTAHHIPILC